MSSRYTSAPTARRAARPATVCFSVHSPTDPAVVPAVAGVLAKRGLVPSRWIGTLCGINDDEMQIDLQVEGLTDQQATLLAAAFRRLICVASVLMSVKEHDAQMSA